MEISRKIQAFLKKPILRTSPMQRICQVLKGPKCYICGLCGKRFEKEKDAWLCLTKNGLSINSLPVFAQKGGYSQTYFCLLCAKSYSNQQDAALCSLKDLQISTFPKILENHLFSLFTDIVENTHNTKRSSLTNRKRAQKQIQSNPIVSSTANASNEPLVEQVKTEPLEPTPDLLPIEDNVTELNTQPLSESEPSESENNLEKEKDVIVAQEPVLEKIEIDSNSSDTNSEIENDSPKSPDEDKKTVLFRKPGQTPFERDNAQYKCSVCSEKFFTKTEVETHFLEHPLAEEM